MTKLTKEVLCGKPEKVVWNLRLADSPLVARHLEYGWSASMERIMKAQAMRDRSTTADLFSPLVLGPMYRDVEEGRQRGALRG